MQTLLACIWLSVIVVLLATFLRQYLGYRGLRRTGPAPQRELPTVSVIVPARNEAQNIGRCVAGLLAQDYPADRYEVIVVDDGSTDATPEIVAAYAAADRRVRLMQAGPLPAGWMGKANGCYRGAQAATGDWLCFVDADTKAEPAMLRTTLQLSAARGVDMLSVHPFQEMHSFWERLILPAQFLLFSVAMDVHRINDPAAPDAVANGQFILINRRTYDAVHGHAAVRADIMDDVAMARVVKGAGHRLLVVRGEDLIRTRMYTGLRSVWGGFSKNAAIILGGVHGAIVGAIAALAVGWLPLLLCLWTVLSWAAGDAQPVALALSLLGAAAVAGAHLGVAVTFRVPLFYSLLFPISHTLAAAITLNSVRRQLRGQNSWKGRVYVTTPAARPSPGLAPRDSFVEL